MIENLAVPTIEENERFSKTSFQNSQLFAYDRSKKSRSPKVIVVSSD
jgi:hypothetical protein